jgi:RNA polymerase sigma-70 factor (ECF subfamily)
MKDKLLICSYRDYLINYLNKKFPNARKEDIEDAVQNAIVKSLRLSNTWKGDSSLKTWLSVIAVNMYTDTFRKIYVKNEYTLNSYEDSYIFDQIPVEDFSETLCESDYQNKLLNELFFDLKDNVFIKTLNMHIIDELDYKNIAYKLDIPLGTVKGRIFRAKKLLQDKYREISCKYEEIGL